MKAQHGASAAGGDLVACCPCSNIRCSGVDGIGRSFCSAAGRRCRQRHSIRIEFRSAGSDVHSRSHLSSAATCSLDSGRLLVGFETLMAGVPWEGMVGVGAVADHNGRLQIDATRPFPPSALH